MDEHQQLAQADRHIHEGIQRIRAQQARVRSAKGDLALRMSLLDAMYQTLRAGLAHRRIIRRIMRRREARPPV